MNFMMIRHGETDYNKTGRIQGLTDNPLNELGELQAEKAGKYLKDNQVYFDLIVSSPLIRAKKTAEIIASNIGYNVEDIIEDKRLTERDFGEFDGELLTDEIKDIVWGNKPGKFEHHEELEKRVEEVVSEVCNSNPDKKILFVCHAHIVKAMVKIADNTKDYYYWLANTAINRFEYKNNEFKIIEINIEEHLK